MEVGEVGAGLIHSPRRWKNQGLKSFAPTQTYIFHEFLYLSKPIESRSEKEMESLLQQLKS
jgi:hypothetical protein